MRYLPSVSASERRGEAITYCLLGNADCAERLALYGFDLGDVWIFGDWGPSGSSYEEDQEVEVQWLKFAAIGLGLSAPPPLDWWFEVSRPRHLYVAVLRISNAMRSRTLSSRPPAIAGSLTRAQRAVDAGYGRDMSGGAIPERDQDPWR
ncbi:hypothetical protein LTR53_012533 [Teratosphaeriaceae sp. CCFEE 6253]|nr:hypothetical protein LTR53_012533 [Teratosphaeriaceae sp. CCFEE 6253]